jgi:serine/threonine-protein kinase RsbW
LEVGVTTAISGAASGEAEVISGVIGLRVPGAIAYRHLAIRLVTTACKMALGADPAMPDGDFEAEVVSAFGEAFNNIAVHSFRGLIPQPVQIEVDWDDEKLVITSVDTGRTFDPDAVAAPDLDQLNERGMGLFIMRSCMSQVEYRPGPPNVLRMVKLRASRRPITPPAPSGSGSARAPDEPGHEPGHEPGNEPDDGPGREPGEPRDKAVAQRGSAVQIIAPERERARENSRRR